MPNNTTYSFNISSASQFNTDIALIDATGTDAGTGNTYNFNITAGFTLDQQLDAINLQGGTSGNDVLIISGAAGTGKMRRPQIPYRARHRGFDVGRLARRARAYAGGCRAPCPLLVIADMAADMPNSTRLTRFDASNPEFAATHPHQSSPCQL